MTSVSLHSAGVPAVPSWLIRGYTGQEHHPAFGLINLNGRMYDPVLGRMLAPDPYVGKPWGTQGYNRYAYCVNNPLIYTDPNGEWVHIVIGAAIGGVVNLGIKAFQGKIHSWGDGFAAFGIGAVAGAVGAATGGAAFTVMGGAVGGAGGFAAGAVGGAVGSAASTPIRSFGNTLYFGDPMMTTKDWVTSIGIGALTGGGINGTIASTNGRNFWNGNLKPSPITPIQIDPIPIKGPQDIGGDDIGNIDLKGNVKQDFFEGTQYSSKVLRQLQENNGNNFHNFPESVKAFQSDGIMKPITGNDNIIRQTLLIEGT